MDHLATMGRRGENWFENNRIKIVLEGVKNLEGTGWKDEKRRAITVKDLLKKREKVANARWGLGSKQSFWTFGLLAFFWLVQNFRTVGGFHRLFWEQNHFLLEEFRLVGGRSCPDRNLVRKTNCGPETVDLFAFPKRSLCPVRAPKNLEILQKLWGQWLLDLPVFRSSSGACLKKSSFAKSLKNFSNSRSLKNLSFRSGTPSLPERNPDLASDSHMKIWGRWKGKSYQNYMKGGQGEKNGFTAR